MLPSRFSESEFRRRKGQDKKMEEDKGRETRERTEGRKKKAERERERKREKKIALRCLNRP